MPNKIDEELKARAVRLVLEHRGEYPNLTAASTAVAKQVGVGKESVRRWVLQADIDAGRREGTTSEECDVFLRGGTRPPQPLMMGFVDTLRAEGHAVESICRVLRE